MFDYMKLIKECEKRAEWYNEHDMCKLVIKYLDLRVRLKERFELEKVRYLNNDK